MEMGNENGNRKWKSEMVVKLGNSRQIICQWIRIQSVGAADGCSILWFLSCPKPASVISYFGMLVICCYALIVNNY